MAMAVASPPSLEMFLVAKLPANFQHHGQTIMSLQSLGVHEVSFTHRVAFGSHLERLEATQKRCEPTATTSTQTAVESEPSPPPPPAPSPPTHTTQPSQCTQENREEEAMDTAVSAATCLPAVPLPAMPVHRDVKPLSRPSPVSSPPAPPAPTQSLSSASTQNVCLALPATDFHSLVKTEFPLFDITREEENEENAPPPPSIAAVSSKKRKPSLPSSEGAKRTRREATAREEEKKQREAGAAKANEKSAVSESVVASASLSREKVMEGETRESDESEKDKGILQCAKCSIPVRGKDCGFFHHSVTHIDTLRHGERFTCKQCPFTSNNVHTSRGHRKRNHTIVDRVVDAANMQFINECLSLFAACFPKARGTPRELQKVLRAAKQGGKEFRNKRVNKADETLAPEPGTNAVESSVCTKCSVSIPSSDPVTRCRSLLSHSLSHLTKKDGKRFHCKQCNFKTTDFSTMRTHGATEKHEYTDRARDAEDKTFVVCCARLFSSCFPRDRMPRLYRAVLASA